MKYFAGVFAAVLMACPPSAKEPEDYGKELQACLDQSATADAYTACCTDVAHRHGRDPSFCVLPDAPVAPPDGGAS